MNRTAVVAMGVALVAVACGGTAPSTEHPTADNSDMMHVDVPLEIAAPGEPERDTEVVQRAEQDCDQACLLVHGCLPDVALERCVDRCLHSRWVASNATYCLGLRVLWSDEEGCARIGPTWSLFDDNDDCGGPPPDER